jgi:hypothetical protein
MGQLSIFINRIVTTLISEDYTMEFLLGLALGAVAAGAFAWMKPDLFKSTADSVESKVHPHPTANT